LTLNSIDTTIIVAYLVMMVVIGLYASRKQSSVEDYFVASGQIRTLSIACLWLAGWIGGASIVGGTEKAYGMGISAAWYIGSMVFGCLMFGSFFAARIKRLGDQKKLLTYPELMESRYDSRTRIVAAITTIAAYVATIAAQLVAAAVVMQTLLGIEFLPALALASAVTVLYTATGGFLAITYTDWVQVGILFVGVVLVGIPVAIHSGGTWAAMTGTLPASYFDIGAWGWPAIAAMVVSITLSFFTMMDSYTRCYAARNPETARRGTLLTIVLLVPLLIGTVWMGMTSQLLYPGLDDSGGILTRFVMDYFPTGLRGLLLVGILAALMSTADICILTASASATKDIYQRYVNPAVDQKTLFRLSMLMSVVVGASATLMAWLMQDIINIILISFTINSAALFVPSIAMVYAKRVSKTAGFWSTSCSLLTVVCWYAGAELGISPLTDIDPLWPGLAVSIVLFTLLSMRENAPS
jgi:SSS family solute:Na+ symporter